MGHFPRHVDLDAYASAVLQVMPRRQARQLRNAILTRLADPGFDLDIRPVFSTERVKFYSLAFEARAGLVVELAYFSVFKEQRVVVASIQLELEPDGSFHRRVASAYKRMLVELAVVEDARPGRVSAYVAKSSLAAREFSLSWAPHAHIGRYAAPAPLWSHLGFDVPTPGVSAGADHAIAAAEPEFA